MYNMFENGFNVKNSSKVFLWSLFLPQVLSIISLIIFSLFFKDVNEMQNSLFYVFVMTLISQVAFFVIYLLFQKSNHLKPFYKDFSLINFKNLMLCILISVIAVLGLVYFVGLFDLIFYQIGYTASSIGLPLDTFWWFLLNVLISAVCPAIFEELVFRKIIFGGLKKLGFWFGAIVSSVMFMIVHQSLGSFIYPIIMGIIFCLIVEKTGSVLYSMIVHFCNNFIVLLIEYLGNISGKSILPTINDWWQYLIAIFVAIIAVGLICYIIKKHLMLEKNNEQIVCEKWQLNNNEEIKDDELANCQQTSLQIKSDYKICAYSLGIGFIFWLIIIITSLV